MKREWRVRRAMVTQEDGPRRWDQVYQHLLQWTSEREQAEVRDARSDLRERCSTDYI